VTRNKLFFTFLLFLPSQLALHFWPDSSLIFGIRVDYLAPTIYFSEILLWIALVFWKPKVVLFLVIAVCLHLLSFSPWVRILESILLSCFVLKEREWARKHGVSALVYGVIGVSFLALLQFLLQRSVGGVLYWIGERSFTKDTIGIAKFGVLLRPYATFPHPNVLGAYGVVVLLLIQFFVKKKKLKGWGRVSSFVIIFLSFSQAVWVSLPGLLVKRFTSVLLFVVVILSFVALPGNSYEVTSRNALAKKAAAISVTHPLGVGLGNFVSVATGNEHLQSLLLLDARLRFQPVHNVFLLVLSELGIPGFVVLVSLLYYYSKCSNKFGKSLLTVFLLTGFLDHYWFTLWQPMALLALSFPLGFSKTSR
jgi:hypothetical protein